MFAVLDENYYTRWYSGHEDGVSDANLVFAHELLQRVGYERVVFYDRDTPLSRLEFAKWAKSDRKMFFMLFKRDGTPIALVWLTDPSVTGKQTFAHFSTLGTAAPEECLEAGKLLIAFIGRETQIRQLIGLTPCCYRHAVAFSRALGFQPLTILEKAVMCRRKERDAVLSICSTGNAG